MNRRVRRARARGLAASAALALITASCGGASPAGPADGAGAGPERAPAHGALLLVVDTLRADRLSCYGSERPTPAIDDLAAQGTLYLENRAQGSWTRPSMQSLMSGLWVGDEYARPAAQTPFLAQVLSEAGVETAAFVANPVVGVHAGFARGFDTFEVETSGLARGSQAVDFLERWLDERGGRPERPWFVWLHLIDPHHPYEPLPQDDAYADELERPHLPALLARWRQGWRDAAQLDPGHEDVSSFEEAVVAMVRDSNHYDGEVRAVDRFVGQALALLAERGLADETLVVLASDHGEMLWEYRDYPRTVRRLIERVGHLPLGARSLFAVGHAGWTYDLVWRTPLIVRGPGFEAGARVEGLCANVDVFPTVLAALDVEPAGPLDGVALQGSRAPGHDLVFGHGRGTTAVRDGRGWTLIEHGVARFDEGRPTRELLRPQSPDRAPRDLAERFPPQVARLARALSTWRDGLVFAGESGESDEDRRVLEQLGYAPGDDDGR